MQLCFVLRLLALGAAFEASADVGRASHAQLRAGERAPGEAPTPLLLEVHYETQCPYSINFLAGPLQEVWKDDEVRRRLDVSMYASGNVATIESASVSEGYKFWHPEVRSKSLPFIFQCQHGSEECLGNAIQACVVNLTGSAAKYIPYVVCMANASKHNVGIEKSSYECLTPTGLEPQAVKQCVEGAANNVRLHEIAHFTKKVRNASYVPWIVLNGEHVPLADGASLYPALCSHLSEPKPSKCATLAAEESSGPVGWVKNLWHTIWPFSR